MVSAKLATLGLLRIIVFWNKGYVVIVSVHDAANKFFSRNSKHPVDVAMWPKFGNFGFFIKEVVITSTL